MYVFPKHHTTLVVVPKFLSSREHLSKGRIVQHLGFHHVDACSSFRTHTWCPIRTMDADENSTHLDRAVRRKGGHSTTANLAKGGHWKFGNGGWERFDASQARTMCFLRTSYLRLPVRRDTRRTSVHQRSCGRAAASVGATKEATHPAVCRTDPEERVRVAWTELPDRKKQDI